MFVRPVAQFGRASVSKTEGWGFDSLLACHYGSATENSWNMDKLKLIIAVALLGAGVAGFYYYADESLLMRVIGLLAVAAVALMVSYQTAIGRQSWAFVSDAQTEMKKVVWPTRKEAIQTTAIVVVMVFLVGLFLWALDSTLLWLVKMLTGQGV